MAKSQMSFINDLRSLAQLWDKVRIRSHILRNDLANNGE